MWHSKYRSSPSFISSLDNVDPSWIFTKGGSATRNWKCSSSHDVENFPSKTEETFSMKCFMTFVKSFRGASAANASFGSSFYIISFKVSIRNFQHTSIAVNKSRRRALKMLCHVNFSISNKHKSSILLLARELFEKSLDSTRLDYIVCRCMNTPVWFEAASERG